MHFVQLCQQGQYEDVAAEATRLREKVSASNKALEDVGADVTELRVRPPLHTSASRCLARCRPATSPPPLAKHAT